MTISKERSLKGRELGKLTSSPSVYGGEDVKLGKKQQKSIALAMIC
ncbi:MAG: hypothetical protein GPJ27_10565 [Microcystis aeruginosa L111-01]|nr:hypothetical protein [Microcystis aeruginosa W13-16]NCQ74057.1 hypothetical protein [Microcystis aeruginosa W13-13]NCQ78509.1 hypothetical protein [Microcystis aeruginosa W13-15]NCR22331.1 hypothetical protein [Microcystis aeruginosa L111-01]NCR45394.1 hypothetical protein [Microcystis aeruginosa SX13-01]NCR91625.1 hypothetical protein [Microcystis aeruginosa G13-10]NCS36048.1 hypothetical protein [Microcystis aeruginosa G11-01]